jgi:hypothetical protein
MRTREEQVGNRHASSIAIQVMGFTEARVASTSRGTRQPPLTGMGDGRPVERNTG